MVSDKLRRWESYLSEYRLPAWDEIPNMGLYMEQVLTLLDEYLDYLPPELKGERQVATSSAINNYVRAKLMPRPVKKRYYRVHIAYLIMICTLKQVLSTALLKGVIPVGISEDEVREIYGSYRERHAVTASYFVNQVRIAAAEILGYDETADITCSKVDDLVTSAAIAGGFAQLLSEKLLLLRDEGPETP